MKDFAAFSLTFCIASIAAALIGGGVGSSLIAKQCEKYGKFEFERSVYTCEKVVKK